jgi:hypothetical protein
MLERAWVLTSDELYLKLLSSDSVVDYSVEGVFRLKARQILKDR